MNHLEIALSQYGIKEVVGSGDNPMILRYFDEIGYEGSKLKDETSWCSAYVNWVMKTAGKQYTKKLNARSWMEIGEPVDEGCQNIGDVVVFWRESEDSWKGHVGFYINDDADKIYVLGGNQNNMVCIQAYPKDRLLGYRYII